jgi:hypothetical protein
MEHEHPNRWVGLMIAQMFRNNSLTAEEAMTAVRILSHNNAKPIKWRK